MKGSIGFWIAAASLTLARPAFVVGQEARWQLSISHTIGDAKRDQTLFSDIRGIAVNKAGEVFVLDSKAQEIRMFNRGGGFVKVVTRKGHGPGELINANGMLATPGGGFVVNDDENSRLTVWKADGAYERQIPLMSNYGAWVWESGWDSEQRVVDRTVVFRGRGVPSSHVLRRIRFTGSSVDTLPEPSCSPPGPKKTTVFIGARNRGPGMMVPFVALERKTIDGKGFLWCSPGDTYRIVRYAIGSATPSDVITRIVAPDAVSKRERDSVLAVVDSFAKKWPGGNTDPTLVPMTKPAIEGMIVDDQGKLWVKRPATNSASTRYDVWERGRLIATIESPLHLAREIPIVIVRDMFYAVAVDEDGVQSVVVAKITR